MGCGTSAQNVKEMGMDDILRLKVEHMSSSTDFSDVASSEAALALPYFHQDKISKDATGTLRMRKPQDRRRGRRTNSGAPQQGGTGEENKGDGNGMRDDDGMTTALTDERIIHLIALLRQYQSEEDLMGFPSPISPMAPTSTPTTTRTKERWVPLLRPHGRRRAKLFPNHQRAEECRRKFWGLGHQKWREAIDQKHWRWGRFVYDLCLHGGNGQRKEVGYLSSIYDAWCYASCEIGRKSDADTWRWINYYTMRHPGNHWFNGNFRYLRQANLSLISNLSELSEETVKEFNETLPHELCNVENLKGKEATLSPIGGVAPDPRKYSHRRNMPGRKRKTVRNYVGLFLHEFYTSVGCCVQNTGKLRKFRLRGAYVEKKAGIQDPLFLGQKHATHPPEEAANDSRGSPQQQNSPSPETPGFGEYEERTKGANANRASPDSDTNTAPYSGSESGEVAVNPLATVTPTAVRVTVANQAFDEDDDDADVDSGNDADNDQSNNSGAGKEEELLWDEWPVPLDKLLPAIAVLQQRLSRAEPSRDGNTRTLVILINKLLCDCGHHPAVFRFPDDCPINTLGTWSRMLQEGLERWERFVEAIEINGCPTAAPAEDNEVPSVAPDAEDPETEIKSLLNEPPIPQLPPPHDCITPEAEKHRLLQRLKADPPFRDFMEGNIFSPCTSAAPPRSQFESPVPPSRQQYNAFFEF